MEWFITLGMLLLGSSAFAADFGAASLARYYAPAPLSHARIVSQTVEVPLFDPEQGLDWRNTRYLTVTSVDLDELTAEFLKSLQEAPAASFPPYDAKKLAIAKDRLVSAISQRVAPIYSSPEGDLTEARQLYSQKLKSDLGFAYNDEAEILRAAPVAPNLGSARAFPSEGDRPTLDGARFYDLEFAYSRPEAQDDLYFDLVQPGSQSLLSNQGRDATLLASLVQFNLLYPEIRRELGGQGLPARQARAAFLELLGNVVDAYSRWETSQPMGSLPNSTVPGVHLREHPSQDGKFVAEIIARGMSGAIIEFQNYRQMEIAPNTFVYVDAQGCALTWRAAKELPRAIRLLKLNVLKIHSVSVQSWIIRNENVRNGDAAVNPEFVFRSELSGLLSPVTAQLEYPQPMDLGGGDQVTHELSHYLVVLFKALGPDPNLPLEIQLDVQGYSIPFESGPRILIPLVRTGAVQLQNFAEWSELGSNTINQLSEAILSAYREVGKTMAIEGIQFQLRVSQGGVSPLVLQNVFLNARDLR